ncbi:MAG: hypothetical protein ACO3AJ_03920 [Vulcanococcus sp.]
MVLSGVQDRIAPLQAWLFPQRVYLELQDQAVTAMALEGRQVLLLERLPLPAGTCFGGKPSSPDALGDLLGDWLLERGFGGARVRAVLPVQAAALRLLQGSAELAASQPEALQWPWPAETPTDLIAQPLLVPPGRSLLAAAPTELLESWIEAFALAALPLDQLQPAVLCAGYGAQNELILLVEAEACTLLRFEAGVPQWQWSLPAPQPVELLLEALTPCLAYWPQCSSLELVVSAGADLDPQAFGALLQQDLPVRVDVRDPMAAGWLLDARGEGAPLSTALLWGLAAAEVLP